MLIKFTHDFRGKLTNENFYLKGFELEVNEDVGLELVELGHAVDVTPEPDPPAPEPKKAPEKVEEPTPEPDPEINKPRRSSKPKKGTPNA